MPARSLPWPLTLGVGALAGVAATLTPQIAQAQDADTGAEAQEGLERALEHLVREAGAVVGDDQAHGPRLALLVAPQRRDVGDVLAGGADDIGGLLLDGELSPESGQEAGRTLSVDDIAEIAHTVGRLPRQRRTDYGDPPEGRRITLPQNENMRACG